MTHDRGAALVIGGVATAAFAADVAFAASRWSGGFRRSFLVALVGLIVLGIAAWLLRLAQPIGADRVIARRRQRINNAILVVLLVAALVVNDAVGANSVGQMAGLLAGLAAGFAVFSAAWLVRAR